MYYFLTLALSFFLTFFSFSNVFCQEDIPPELKKWKSWVLHNHPDVECPPSGKEKVCTWPSSLEIDVIGNLATFNYKISVFKEGFVEIPGNSKIWPADVTIDDMEAAPADKNSFPYLFLSKGVHEIKGKLLLNGSNSLHVPQGTALIKLSLNGKQIIEPKLDTKNWLLFLSPKSPIKPSHKPKKEIKFEIFRLIKDGVPIKIESKIRMFVSGAAREIVLKNMIPKGFIPIKAFFPFKWAFGENGELYLQVRPGSWEFNYTLASLTPLKEIRYWNTDPKLPKSEIWSFKENVMIRKVEITGAISIDPTQTDIPQSWKNYPAFLMKPQGFLKIIEKVRGAEKKLPNNLRLKRTMWLSFKGNGYFVKDEIRGSVNRAWRINAIAPFELGRVIINGKPRLITKDTNGIKGVEIRDKHIELEAEGQLKGPITHLKNLGWLEEFSSAKIRLFLPPGWSVFAALGSDITSGTWIDKWTLLDIFLLLLLSWASFKCFGPVAGILMFLFLLLGIQDPKAPTWSWLNPIVAVALLYVVKKESIVKALKSYRILSCIFILVYLLPYSIQQIKYAIYPQLSYKEKSNIEEAALLQPLRAPTKSPKAFLKKGGKFLTRSLELADMYQAQQQNFSDKLDFEPGAKIQTGPGLPDWKGKEVTLTWSGPIGFNQGINIYFISPWLNTIFGIIKGIAPVFLLLFASGISIKSKGNFRIVIFFIISFSHLFLPANGFCSFPSDNLLKELEKRVTEPAKCHPNCSNIKATAILIDRDRLEIRFMVKSLAKSILRLPINLNSWQPKVIKAQKTSEAFTNLPLRRDKDGYLLVALDKGKNDIIISGQLEKDLILPVPFTLHNVTAYINDKTWKIAGIDRYKNVRSQIRIFKRVGKKKDIKEKLPQNLNNGIPAFLRIKRYFNFSLKWQVTTTITRLSSYQGPIELDYNLIKGEKIITPGIKVKDNRIIISLKERQNSLTIHSILNKANVLHLKANKTALFVEEWTVKFSPIWHINFYGIPEILSQKDIYIPTWRPWPGEELKLEIFKPEAAKGPIKTIKSCNFIQTPGPRLTESRLSLEILSSIGTNQQINLPQNSKVKEVKIDGKKQSFDPDASSITLPLHPGTTTIELLWLEKRGLENIFKTTRLKLDIPLTNININLKYPKNRWALFVNGPIMGPAILFWGGVILTLILGFLLARLPNSPLNSAEWIMLGVGLLPVNPMIIIPVFLTIIILHFRGLYWERFNKIGAIKFNLLQFLIIILTISSVIAIIFALNSGLLGDPDMQIEGNGSYPGNLYWYQDKANGLPHCTLISTSIWFYRGAMLLWALWLVRAIIRWIPWGWENFSKGTSWKKIRFNIRVKFKRSKKEELTKQS